MNCPCKDCITFAICNTRNFLLCSLLYNYLSEVMTIDGKRRRKNIIEKLFKRQISASGAYKQNSIAVLWITWNPTIPEKVTG